MIRDDKRRQHILLSTKAKNYRYNVRGFVEELPPLPDARIEHVCGALPTGVRPAQIILFHNRHSLLLEEEGGLKSSTFLRCLRSSQAQKPGLPLHPFHEHCIMLEHPLWEELLG